MSLLLDDLRAHLEARALYAGLAFGRISVNTVPTWLQEGWSFRELKACERWGNCRVYILHISPNRGGLGCFQFPLLLRLGST